jgi:outer membrane protein assembly factor BamE (lipoprotein component of BamABCDE complex)
MIATASKLKPMARAATLGVLCLALTACVPIYRKHGYVPTEEDLAQVAVGVDTRDSVIAAIGSPGTSGVLKESGYYYVTSRMRHYGAKQPQEVSRELVAVTFDQRGVVRNIERYGMEDGEVIALNRRVTSSSVEDKTFIRQLMGNLGRFSTGSVVE